ncbi:MAG: primosomal protein N' [Mariprofundaceae bacterium]
MKRLEDLAIGVAVFSPLDGLFHYLWPQAWHEKPQVGLRVIVPFGKSVRWGVILSCSEKELKDYELKTILDCPDRKPLFDEKRLRWLKRAGQYYLATPGNMLEMAFAWAAHEERRRWRMVESSAAELHEVDAKLMACFTNKRALSAATLLRRLDAPHDFYHRIHQAESMGVLKSEVASKQNNTIAQMVDEAIPTQLRPAQKEAVDAILAEKSFATFLLFGVTGSGKTEVYLQAAAHHIAAGKQVLVLVPEIGLTPQWLMRLHARFSRVAVWHSALGTPDRLAVRQQLADVEILIGTRSALFLPLPRLAMIIIDEEHDGSFKQKDGVAYSARDMGILLAQELDTPIVLGSATPSLESWKQVQEKRYKLLRLPERIHAHPTIPVEVIDLRDYQGPLTEPLIEAISSVQKKGGQSMLYLNRRGYAPALQCTACGDTPECPHCSIRLTLHRQRQQLRCHSCDYRRRVPQVCIQCGEQALMPLGAGTEQLEEQLSVALPDLRFARLDRDAVGSSKKLVERLSTFAAGDLDCLIGTQMLIKGHHFPNVQLIGVVQADLGLNMPDFRAGERWWQQLTQVMGRVGRGEKAGRIMVQTCNPDTAWLTRLGDVETESILQEELQLRQQLHYPPYARWTRIVFSAREQHRANDAAERLAHLLKQRTEIRTIGPMPSPIERIAGRYRIELILQDENRKSLPWMLAPVLSALPVPYGVRRKVDVDPLDLM